MVSQCPCLILFAIFYSWTTSILRKVLKCEINDTSEVFSCLSFYIEILSISHSKSTLSELFCEPPLIYLPLTHFFRFIKDFKITFENFIFFRKNVLKPYVRARRVGHKNRSPRSLTLEKIFSANFFYSFFDLQIFLESEVNVRDLGLQFPWPNRRALLYGLKTFFRKKNQILKSYFWSTI